MLLHDLLAAQVHLPTHVRHERCTHARPARAGRPHVAHSCPGLLAEPRVRLRLGLPLPGPEVQEPCVGIGIGPQIRKVALGVESAQAGLRIVDEMGELQLARGGGLVGPHGDLGVGRRLGGIAICGFEG